MRYIETNPLKNSTIMLLYSERDRILLDPPYQRMGGVWTIEKKQLLIDSIFNNYDIPKIYFHSYSRQKSLAEGFDYSVIDGRQRLETIWSFIDGEFPLSEDFEYQQDDSINLSSLTYDDISSTYPRIKIKFDSFVLPIIGVETDDEDLIEDMFSRLNEAVPLNAAEKRNAIGGDLVKAIRELSDNEFFTEQVRVSNKRFQHREVCARFLHIEDCLLHDRPLIDTKKVYLDALAKKYAQGREDEVERLKASVENVLQSMTAVFMDRDSLLGAQGNLTVYYLLFRQAEKTGKLSLLGRRKFLDFVEQLKRNREQAAADYEGASFELLEYDRLSQQGTNDASNIKERVSVLAAAMGL